MTIEKSLRDCLKSNSVSNDIRHWSIKVKNYGIACMIAILSGGAVLSVAEVYDIYDEFRFFAFLSAYLTWIIIAIIELFFYKFCSSLLDGLASIVNNSGVSAKVAAYQTQLLEEHFAGSSAENDAERKEDKIQKAQENFRNAPSKPAGSAVPVRIYKKEDGRFDCPKCGKEQDGKRTSCWSCGQVFVNGQNVPYWCGKCGNEGPFSENVCPKCGSTIKVVN